MCERNIEDLRLRIAVSCTSVVEAKGGKLNVGGHHKIITELVDIVANRQGALEVLKALQETK